MTEDEIKLSALIGREFWSVYVDSAGRKSHYEDRQLVEPWCGVVVAEQRAGGLLVVLAKNLPEDSTDLYNAYYVIIPYSDAASYLLFATQEAAEAEYVKQRLREISVVLANVRGSVDELMGFIETRKTRSAGV